MRVLFQSRSDLLHKRGGDTTQMLRTREALERLGVRVDLALEPVADYGPYDLVHLFNIQTFRETRPQMEQALAAGKPVALSPIWWRMTEYEIHRIRRPSWNHLRRVLGTKATAFLFDRWMRARRPNFREQSWILRHASVLLPNSRAEGEILCRDFGLPPSRTLMRVVPNAVDASRFQGASPGPFVARYGLRDFVLCAARIENRKNQANLIRAMRSIEAPLVLVGQLNPNQVDYVSLCQALAYELGEGRVRLIEHLETAELASAYAAAKVHALVSWFESPGLASLEAAVAGCNIVTTNRAPVAEYFGNLAWTCDPGRVGSIRDAIRAALAAPRSTALRERIIREFTWERAAAETLKAYEDVLRRSNDRRADGSSLP